MPIIPQISRIATLLIGIGTLHKKFFVLIICGSDPDTDLSQMVGSGSAKKNFLSLSLSCNCNPEIQIGSEMTNYAFLAITSNFCSQNFSKHI